MTGYTSAPEMNSGQLNAAPARGTALSLDSSTPGSAWKRICSLRRIMAANSTTWCRASTSVYKCTGARQHAPTRMGVVAPTGLYRMAEDSDSFSVAGTSNAGSSATDCTMTEHTTHPSIQAQHKQSHAGIRHCLIAASGTGVDAVKPHTRQAHCRWESCVMKGHVLCLAAAPWPALPSPSTSLSPASPSPFFTMMFRFTFPLPSDFIFVWRCAATPSTSQTTSKRGGRPTAPRRRSQHQTHDGVAHSSGNQEAWRLSERR